DDEFKNISNTLLKNKNITQIGNWSVYPNDKSIYHQMGDDNNKQNIKLVNNDGREIVVYKKDNSYKIVDDNLNIGTYNYSNPNGGLNTFMHGIADVLPYYIYGNTPYDSFDTSKFSVTLKHIFGNNKKEADENKN
ncbi:hypothetical protein CUREO10432_09040, partial [Campylobacter ureolyticus]